MASYFELSILVSGVISGDPLGVVVQICFSDMFFILDWI